MMRPAARQYSWPPEDFTTRDFRVIPDLALFPMKSSFRQAVVFPAGRVAAAVLKKARGAGWMPAASPAPVIFESP